MTETRETNKFHPSPAKRQEDSSSSGQTDGRNQEISGEAEHPAPDVLKEQEKTDQGLPRKAS